MSKKSTMNNIASIAVAAAVAASFSTVASALEDGDKEKCYGVVKAAKNDCGNAKHACAGHASMDKQNDEWLYLPKGTCERLAGGSVEPVVEVEVEVEVETDVDAGAESEVMPEDSSRPAI